jgi:predicted nuclease of predicted toxin-antitoxin system
LKLLADMGVSATTVETLRLRGHDATHLLEQGLERLPDREIMEKAAREGRIVLTMDLDFADLLAARPRTLPSVILFRIHSPTPEAVTQKAEEILSRHHEALQSGSIITAEDGRNRVRRLPIHPQRTDP